MKPAKPNPLTGLIDYEKQVRRLKEGLEVTGCVSATLPEWAHVYIGEEPVIGCRAADLDKYVAQTRDLQESLISEQPLEGGAS